MGIFQTMKFTKYTFLMLGLVSMFSICDIRDVMAANCDKAADAGKFCKTWGSNNYKCRAGCYCPGGSKNEAGAHDVARACDERWSNETMWTTLHAAQIWLCPESHPKSDAGSDEITDCYKIKDNGQNEYYTQSSSSSSSNTKTVSKGYYWSKSSHQEVSCATAAITESNFASSWYCPGGEFSLTKDKPGIESCPYGHIASLDRKSCETPGIKPCNAGEYMPERGTDCAKCNFFMDCPGGDYKTNSYQDGSDWACSIPSFNSDDLFNVVNLRGGTVDTLVIPNINGGPCVKMKDVRVTCNKGQYLGKLRRFCDPCPKDTVCKGGTFGLSLYNDQGLGEKCTSPATPDNTTGKCSRDTVHCIEGTYLPANKTSSNDCKACPSGKNCPGGDYEIGWDVDQGVFENTEITVSAGYYLPKGSKNQKGCTGSSKYCPGGSFYVSGTEDQGIYNCPAKSRATEDKSACAVTLTKKQMMYGMNGTGGRYSENAVQCWTKTGANYKACMGFKSDGSLVSTSVPGLSINLKPVKAELKLGSPLVQRLQ